MNRSRPVKVLESLPAVALLLLIACACACGEQEAHPSPVTGLTAPVGPEAPNLSLLSLDGSTSELVDYRGQPVIVNFWATWCEPCTREFPSLMALHDKLAARGLRVLAVSIDEDAAAVRGFLTRTPLPFEVFWDPSKKAFSECGGALTPTSFVLDRNGRVVERIDGETDWTDPELLSTLERVLGQA